jgi:hypothetical protein
MEALFNDMTTVGTEEWEGLLELLDVTLHMLRLRDTIDEAESLVELEARRETLESLKSRMYKMREAFGSVVNLQRSSDERLTMGERVARIEDHLGRTQGWLSVKVLRLETNDGERQGVAEKKGE